MKESLITRAEPTEASQASLGETMSDKVVDNENGGIRANLFVPRPDGGVEGGWTSPGMSEDGLSMLLEREVINPDTGDRSVEQRMYPTDLIEQTTRFGRERERKAEVATQKFGADVVETAGLAAALEAEVPKIAGTEDASTVNSSEQAVLSPRQEVSAGIDFVTNGIMDNRINGRPDQTPRMTAISLEAGLLGRMEADGSGASAQDIADVKSMIATLKASGNSLHMPGSLTASAISQKLKEIKRRMEGDNQ